MSNRVYIDVRNLQEVKIPIAGAVSLPYYELLKDKESFCELCKDAEEIILICRSGRRSNFARTILNKCGIENVRVIKPSQARKELEDA